MPGFYVLEYLEFTQLSNPGGGRSCPDRVLEYLEFTQLSNPPCRFPAMRWVLEYLEFTQLSNNSPAQFMKRAGFRVPGIYTALKHEGGKQNVTSRF